MPRVSAFAGLHYSLARFGAPTLPARVRLSDDDVAPPARLADITDVACPPYDVIDEPTRRQLLDRHDRNAVRLEYSAHLDPYAAAKETLRDWVADGTLERRGEPALYSYRHATASAPEELTVEGMVVRVLLEPWGGGIRPHEHTMPGPKADRLALLGATRTQLSPILALYFDPSQARNLVPPLGDEWRARDEDGLIHQLRALEPDDRLLADLARQTLFVADGHHRYETALAHQAEVRANPRRADAAPGELAADWTMMMVVNAELSELQILPTHRILLDGDPDALRALAAGDDPLFTSIPMPPAGLAAALEERRTAREPTFGLVLSVGEGYLLVGDPAGLAARLGRVRMTSAARDLDLTSLHVALLEDRLGISADDLAGGKRLAYTRDEAEARQRVATGDARAAILVRPTRLDQLADVATAGDVMPQKSTYFYPKLLTGMVFNPLED
jgi:uncharacterized protein (DUF1015 family)